MVPLLPRRSLSPNLDQDVLNSPSYQLLFETECCHCCEDVDRSNIESEDPRHWKRDHGQIFELHTLYAFSLNNLCRTL